MPCPGLILNHKQADTNTNANARHCGIDSFKQVDIVSGNKC